MKEQKIFSTGKPTYKIVTDNGGGWYGCTDMISELREKFPELSKIFIRKDKFTPTVENVRLPEGTCRHDPKVIEFFEFVIDFEENLNKTVEFGNGYSYRITETDSIGYLITDEDYCERLYLQDEIIIVE